MCARQFPIQALLRLRSEVRGNAIAVLHGIAPTETVCAMNARAQQLGVKRGMTRVEAESFAALVLLRRSLVEEQFAKAAVLEGANRFSPSIEDASTDSECIFVLDIAGTAKLFGDSQTVGMQMRDMLAALGIHASVSISRNFHVSVAMSRTSHGVVVIAQNQTREALAPLPVNMLGISDAHAETFAHWGIHRVGDLAALPEVELISRLGQDAKPLLELARGARAHTFQPMEHVLELQESFEFDSPVEILESLLFVLSPMIEQLIARVGLRALCVATLKIELQLDGGGTQERIVRPALPSLDKRFLLKLAQLDLAAHPPGAGVQAVIVTAEPRRGSKVQLGLFAPQLPESSRLDVTLSQLSALVGKERVGSPVLRDTHCPDSFRQARFALHQANSNDVTANPHAALRRIRPPAILNVQISEQQPAAFRFRESHYVVRNAYGPWRSSGDWWATDVWSQEEWDVVAQTEREEQLCGILMRDRFVQQWSMVAIYD